MSNYSDLYTVVKINVVNIKASSLRDKNRKVVWEEQDITT